eukprot:scaffold191947_cov41-Tisochrysis_lutea.AAC.2
MGKSECRRKRRSRRPRAHRSSSRLGARARSPLSLGVVGLSLFSFSACSLSLCVRTGARTLFFKMAFIFSRLVLRRLWKGRGREEEGGKQ